MTHEIFQTQKSPFITDRGFALLREIQMLDMFGCNVARRLLERMFFIGLFEEPDGRPIAVPVTPLMRSQLVKSSPGSGCFPNRAAWLRAEMAKRDIRIAYTFQKCGGPEHRSVAKVLAGKPVSEKVLQGLAKVLSSNNWPLIERSVIPSD